MRNIIISYGLYENDGRLLSLEALFNNLGNVKVLACTTSKKEGLFQIGNEKYISLKMLFKFYLYVYKNRKIIKNSDLIVIDNYFVAPIGLIIKKIYPEKKIVQDVRELYLFSDLNSFKSKIFMYFEYLMMTKADIVLTANKHRLWIMKKIYQDISNMIVFENIRFLPNKQNNKSVNDSYSLINNKKFNLVSTGGISLNRNILGVLTSIKKLKIDYHLFLIGGGRKNDIDEVKKFIKENNLTNKITIIDKIPLNELSNFVSKCKIGIVHYPKTDMNNKYCSSGKIYEYLNEGLPIVTTDNIPLKDFCDSTKVGLSGIHFDQMIMEIYNNYDSFKLNVANFIKDISPEKYNLEVSSIIKKQLCLGEIDD